MNPLITILKTMLLSVLLLSISLPCYADESLVIEGTGDSQGVLRLLAKKFNTTQSKIIAEIPDSIGSGGGIHAVAQGKALLGRTARSLKQKERKLGLSQFRFALSPIVFVVHPSVSHVDNLSTEQVLSIFSGEYRNWQQLGGSNNKLYAVDREAGDSSRKILEKKFTGFAEIKSKAKIFYNTPAAAEAIAKHKFTIGYLPMSVAKQHGLKILSIDHIYPNEKNIQAGQYPYTTAFYFVAKGDLPPPANRFMEFIRSETGQQIISKLGIVPAF